MERKVFSSLRRRRRLLLPLTKHCHIIRPFPLRYDTHTCKSRLLLQMERGEETGTGSEREREERGGKICLSAASLSFSPLFLSPWHENGAGATCAKNGFLQLQPGQRERDKVPILKETCHFPPSCTYVRPDPGKRERTFIRKSEQCSADCAGENAQKIEKWGIGLFGGQFTNLLTVCNG